MIDNKDKRQFHRAVDSLNGILRSIQTKHPEAEFEFNDEDKEIKIVSQKSKALSQGKKPRNVLVRSFLDGDHDDD